MSWITLEHGVVKTRKPHECQGCRRTFPAGVEMVSTVGMWEGDPPGRAHRCIVCEDFIRDARLLEESEDELPAENWAASPEYRDGYAVTEARHTGYIREAGVPTQRQWIGLLDMYRDLWFGARLRELRGEVRS